MKNLKELALLSEQEQIALGIISTMKEILQQPEVWEKTYKVINSQNDEIYAFLKKCGVFENHPELNIYITGAGSSEFVGNCAAPYLQKKFNKPVLSIATTDFVTHSEYFIMKDKKNLVISMGRSGDSPESVATYNKAKESDPSVMQIIICCNKNSQMVKSAKNDENTLSIILPDETNDTSLVMTSSFTSMVLTLLSLTYLNNLDEFKSILESISLAGQHVIEKADIIKDFISINTTRILYLGTAELKGCAQESRLKALEMTDGKVLSDFNSYLGLRHGPQVFADKSALVIAYLSSNLTRRKYEIDLLKEMQDKKQGAQYLLVCNKKSKNMENLNGVVLELLPNKEMDIDAFNVLPFMIVGQLNGFFKSIQLGHKPDSPSKEATINRVVKGVNIY